MKGKPALSKKEPGRTFLIYTADRTRRVRATSLASAVTKSAIDEVATPILAAFDASCLPQYDRPESPIVAVMLRNLSAR